MGTNREFAGGRRGSPLLSLGAVKPVEQWSSGAVKRWSGGAVEQCQWSSASASGAVGQWSSRAVEQRGEQWGERRGEWVGGWVII